MKRFYFIILFICAYFSASAQCTQVNEDGSVTITYAASPSAEIEREDDGQWTVIGNLEEGTYTDHGVNANEKSVKYRMASLVTAPEFSTILLTVTESGNVADEYVGNWNTDQNASTYKLYSKLFSESEYAFVEEAEPGVLIKQAEQMSVCGIQYRVEAIYNDCSSFSNIVQMAKQDNEGPDTPELLPLSVDIQTQQLVISWKPSQASDTKGYVVCKINENGIRDTLTVIERGDITSYVCEPCSVTDTNKISVFAFDYCRNSSPNSQTYNNIVLKGKRSDCNEPLTLSWNAPDNSVQIRQYEIYMATDEDQTYNLIAQTADLSYQVQLPAINGNVYLYVKHEGCSNVISLDLNNADTLDFIYLETASVSEDNMEITLVAYLDALKEVRGYQLYRQTDDGEFEKVKDIAYTGYSTITMTDELFLPANEHLYTYYLAAPDLCGGNYTYSNSLTAMQLQVDASNQSKIKLSWTPFRPQNWTVTAYQVYRFAERDMQNAEKIGTTTANSYIDNADNMVSATDRTFYVVKAVTNNTSNPDITEYEAVSSNAYAKFESVLFVPTAFCPKDGVHENLKTFKPACHFVRAGTYSFKVFNRQGTLLFETNDTDQGWNGKYKDEFCPVGTYVYKVSFTDSDGMEQNKGGIFLLYD